MDFLEVALHGGKMGFDKIVKMIDELVAQLKKDQTADDEKKTYCEDEFDKTEDKKKVLAQDAADYETMLDDANEAIANLKVEIEALDDGIRALDKEVASATETRKEDNEDFTATVASNAAAVDLLKLAKNRLNKFYNPSQYVAPPKRELSEDEFITQTMNALTQVSVHGSVAPPPAPEANLAYSAKGEESTGVIRLLDNLINDVETEMQQAELEEKDAQGDYERFMSSAAEKRASDSKSITDKQAALADAQTSAVEGKDKLYATNVRRQENEKYLGSLHAECDWLLKNFDMRKEARADEGEALGNAKAVLNGADYSL
jgi:chromosome segregation ATPase